MVGTWDELQNLGHHYLTACSSFAVIEESLVAAALFPSPAFEYLVLASSVQCGKIYLLTPFVQPAGDLQLLVLHLFTFRDFPIL